MAMTPAPDTGFLQKLSETVASAFETYWPGVVTVLIGAIGKALWSGWSTHDDKDSEGDRRQLVRDLDTRTGLELERAWRRIDSLEADVEHERKSGMEHYERTLALADLNAQYLRDWRNGLPPPERVSEIIK